MRLEIYGCMFHFKRLKYQPFSVEDRLHRGLTSSPMGLPKIDGLGRRCNSDGVEVKINKWRNLKVVTN